MLCAKIVLLAYMLISEAESNVQREMWYLIIVEVLLYIIYT